MIPLCLVTGFLGSGKTTLLKRILRERRDEKIVYLVNEFSAADVDGELIADETADTVSVSGGSIFCRCKVGEFITHLGATIPEKFDLPDDPVRGVVVETSGIADPMVATGMMRETGLDEVYTITGVVTVLDPHKFARLLQTLPNVAAQVRAADWVLINKCDVFDEEEIAAAEREARRLNPAAQVLRTSYCEADFDIFEPHDHAGMAGEYALCRDPRYASAQVELREPVDPERLSQALLELGDDLYRAKGFARTTDGMRYVDWSAGRLSVEETLATRVRSELAVIVRGEAESRLAEFVRRVNAS